MKNNCDIKALPTRVVTAGTLFLALVGIILRIICLTSFYDDNIGYYKDSIFPTAMNIFFVASFLFILVYSLVCVKKEYLTTGVEKNIASLIVSGICVVGFGFMSLAAILTFVANSTIFNLILVAASILSAVYFSMNIMKKKTEAQALAAIAVVIVIVYILASSYFDPYTQMNSPNKILLHMSCLASMIFFVSEARCIVGAMRKTLYVISLCAAVFFTGLSSVSVLPLYLAGIIRNHNYFVFDVLLSTLFVYYVFRLVTLFLTADKEIVLPVEAEADTIADETVNTSNESNTEDTSESLTTETITEETPAIEQENISEKTENTEI